MIHPPFLYKYIIIQIPCYTYLYTNTEVYNFEFVFVTCQPKSLPLIVALIKAQGIIFQDGKGI